MARQPTTLSTSVPSTSGASTADAPVSMLASVKARSRRLPCRSDRIAWTTVSSVAPVRPNTAAPARVAGTPPPSVNRPAPTVVVRAEDHKSRPLVR